MATSKKTATKKTKRRISGDFQIKKVVADNPRRPGTKSFKRFEFYRNGMKVEKALSSKLVSRSGFWHDRHDGLIRVGR